MNRSKFASFFADPRAWYAALRWSVFSLTSYTMVRSLARQGLRPATVIDVGANIGQFSVAVAKTFPGCRIYAFEPLPAAAARFRSNLKALKSVTLFELALSDRADRAQFHVNAHSHSSSLLRLGARHREAFPDAQEIAVTDIQTDTLDAALAGAEMPGPVLLKLDVQGAEPRVIEGARATLPRVDYVLLEASFSPLYENEMTFIEVLKLVTAHGFRFLRPVGWLSHPTTGEILQMDALFVNETQGSSN